MVDAVISASDVTHEDTDLADAVQQSGDDAPDGLPAQNDAAPLSPVCGETSEQGSN